MKKLIILVAILGMSSLAYGQTLDEIVNRSYVATGADKLEKAGTIFIEGTMIQMGIEMPMTMIMKKPDKVKVSINYNGMDIITVFDGVKGYTVNPIMGVTEPVEVPQEQLEEIKSSNMFRNELMEYYRKGKLTLAGTEDVNGKPAFKLMETNENGSQAYVFIDKETYLTVKTAAKVSQMGQEMDVESYIKEYSDVQGIKFPKLTVSFINGSEAGSMTMDKIEIDRVVEDSVFSIKK
mgnify:CR=1 FL=1